MLCSLVCVAFLAAPVQAAGPFPDAKPIVAEEQWYKDHQAEEKTIEGILMINKGDGKIGISERFCNYRVVWLENGRPMTRQLFTNGKDSELAAFLGNSEKAFKVKLTGKEVNEVDAKKVNEFWPGKIEATAQVHYGEVGEIKLLGRMQNPQNVYFNQQAASKPRAQLLRGPGDVAALIGYPAGAQYEAQVMQQLNSWMTTRVDWSKHTVILLIPGTGQNNGAIEVNRVAINEQGGFDIYWKPGKAVVGGQFAKDILLLPKTDKTIILFQEGGRAEDKLVIEPPEPEQKKDEKKDEPPKRR